MKAQMDGKRNKHRPFLTPTKHIRACTEGVRKRNFLSMYNMLAYIIYATYFIFHEPS